MSIFWLYWTLTELRLDRSSHPKVFLEKGVLKICSNFTREHPCQSANSIKLLCKFIEITPWHGCSPVYLLHIFRKLFLKNTSSGLLLIRPENSWSISESVHFMNLGMFLWLIFVLATKLKKKFLEKKPHFLVQIFYPIVLHWLPRRPKVPSEHWLYNLLNVHFMHLGSH